MPLAASGGGSGLHGIALLLGLWALAASVCDLRARRIPNLLILPVAITALLAVVVTGQSLLGTSASAAWLGAGVALAPWMLGYVLKRGGAGDVKFAAVLGLAVGAPVAVTGTLLSMVLFGGLSLVLLRAGGRGLRLPLAPVISAGFAIGYVYHHFSH